MRIILIFLVVLTLAINASAQFKSQENQQTSVAQSLVHPPTSINSFLGFLNPDNFLMRHNFAFSYLSSGGTGMSLASYTNSMFYKISDPLNVRFDLTLQGSPFGQYGAASRNDLSRLYLSRAELNYHPWENVFVKLQYRQIPFGYYGYRSPFNSSLMWGDE